MALHKLVRRNYCRKLQFSIKYQNLHSFKEGMILLCQRILEMRQISHLHGSALFTILLKESCEPTIILMKDIFSRLTLKDNNLEPCDTIEDGIVSDFFSGLKLDEKLICNETAQLLPDMPLLSVYLKHSCKE